MSDVNKNFLYNAVYQIFLILVPMVTLPYVSHILGVNNIGIYSYTYSIVSYFMLFSMLGINNYGSREIAKCCNKEDRSKKFKSIYILQLILNIISLLIYLFLIIFIPSEYKIMMLINMIFLISVAFDINWFFFGVEKFKITVTRNMVIKLLSLVLIFIFVKNKNDLYIYTFIMSFTTLLSQIYLWFFLRKEISNVKVYKKDVLKHLKPCLVLFIPVLAYSVYRIMDKTMLGLFSNVTELGNYESAEKIINIPLSFIAALGTVMLPNMSKKDEKNIKKNIYNTFELILFVVMPMIIGLFIISPILSSNFFGSEFTKTGTIIRFLVITICFSAIANVIRTNYLIPLEKDNIYVLSTIIGAIVNLLCNLIFIKKYGSFGACIGTIVAEFLVMYYQIIKTNKEIKFILVVKLLLKYLFKSLIMAIFIILVGLLIKQEIMRLIIQITIGILIYIFLNKSYIKENFLKK